MSRKTMQMALEALEDANDVARMEFSDEDYYGEAITALRQALETGQEPVAHVYLFDKAGRPLVAWDNAKDIKLGDKLYVAPKQWVGLTDEEIRRIGLSLPVDFTWVDFARAIEAKLKEKNG